MSFENFSNPESAVSIKGLTQMVKLLASLTLLLLLLVNLAFGQAEKNPTFKDSLVTVVVYDKTGKVSSRGLGFFVSDAGDVICRLGLIEHADIFEIKTADGKAYPIVKVKATDNKADLALVTADIRLTIPLTVLTTIPAVEQPVTVVSLTASAKPVSTVGVVSGSREVPELGKALTINPPLTSGLNESLAFNNQGEIVGMGIATMENGKPVRLLLAGERLSKIVPRLVYIVPSGLIAPHSFMAVPSGQPGANQPPPNVERKYGVVESGAVVSRSEAVYPPLAKAAKITGSVVLEAIVDEAGNVIWANAVSGHPLLKEAAVNSARLWKFSPTKLDGQPVKFLTGITVNFRM